MNHYEAAEANEREMVDTIAGQAIGQGPAAAVALNAMGYERVINSRFVTTRNGGPINCNACGEALVMGAAFSTVKAGQWTQWCAACAASYPAMVGRMYTAVVNEAKAACGVNVPQNVRDNVSLARDEARKLIDEPTDRNAFGMATGYLTAARIGLADVERNQRVARLSVDPIFLGLGLAMEWLPKGTRHQLAAESISLQWATKGSISDRQRSYAEALGDMARKAESKGHAPSAWANELHEAIIASTIDDGYYAVPAVAGDNDLTFVRIGTSDKGHRFMRHIIGGRPESDDDLAPLAVEVHACPSMEWCGKVLAAIIASTPAVAAATYGQHIGRCGMCHRRLTDKASRAAGIGPVCIQSL